MFLFVKQHEKNKLIVVNKITLQNNDDSAFSEFSVPLVSQLANADGEVAFDAAFDAILLELDNVDSILKL